MKKLFEFDCTGIGFSNRETVDRMWYMGKAGLVLTAVGLVLSAITHYDTWHNSVWCTTDDKNLDDRMVIHEAATNVVKQWNLEEECNK